MKIIDLSHVISPEMPVYPGTEPPVITRSCTIEKDGFTEKLISMSSHTGTHVDAPAHMIKDGLSLDDYDIDYFIGKGYVVDLSEMNKRIIEPEDILAHQDFIMKTEFLLFYTGWDKHWGDRKYYTAYPVLSEKLVTGLTGYGLKGIGLDVISIDPVGSVNFRNHMIVFERDMVIIENLANLDHLIGKEFIFICTPLKIENADGSPVRACAILIQK